MTRTPDRAAGTTGSSTSTDLTSSINEMLLPAVERGDESRQTGATSSRERRMQAPSISNRCGRWACVRLTPAIPAVRRSRCRTSATRTRWHCRNRRRRRLPAERRGGAQPTARSGKAAAIVGEPTRRSWCRHLSAIGRGDETMTEPRKWIATAQGNGDLMSALAGAGFTIDQTLTAIDAGSPHGETIWRCALPEAKTGSEACASLPRLDGRISRIRLSRSRAYRP